MPPRVSTGDRDAVLRQIRWCEAIQTLVNCHCWREVSVCVCVCVCVFACPRSYLRNYTSDLQQIFVHVSYGRGSVLSWRRSDTLCTSGFMDDIIFTHKPKLLDVTV